MGLFDSKKQKPSDDKISFSDQLLTLTDVVAPSAVSITPRFISVSGVSVRTYYAVSYPRFLNDGWLEPILNMAREIDVSIFIHPIDTAETLKKFQKKVAEVQSQINIKEERGEGVVTAEESPLFLRAHLTHEHSSRAARVLPQCTRCLRVKNLRRNQVRSRSER